MKKFLSFFLALLICYEMHALPLGNPMEASLLYNGLTDNVFCIPDVICFGNVIPCNWFSFRFGYYGDHVFNRHIQSDTGDRVKFLDFEITTNAGYLAVNFCHYLDIFGTLGETRFRTFANLSEFQSVFTENGDNEGELNNSFSYSVGARGTLLECGCMYCGAEFQYFFSDNDLTRATLLGRVSLYPDDTLIKYREWQIGLGMAYRIQNLVPYIGLKWSSVQIIADGPQDDTPNDPDFENSKHWGYAVGTSLVACEAMSLTVEGRFGDEKALYVNGQLQF